MPGSPPASTSQWRFLQLTLFLAAWMLFSPLVTHRWVVSLTLQAVFLNAALVTLWANPQWRVSRRAMVGLWMVSALSSLATVLPLPVAWTKLADVLDSATTLVLVALLAAGILRFVFRGRRLTSDGFFATIVVYLLLAFVFSQVYFVMVVLDPASFALPVPAAERAPHLLHNDLLYFSLVTLATVGYGDILPRGETARMLAMLEAVAGQFYVAVVVAVFVGMYTTQRRD